MGQHNGKWLILGGNQGNKVCIASYSPGLVIAIRWPAGVALPNAVAPLAQSGVIQGSLVSAVSIVGVLGEGLITNKDAVDQAKGWIAEGSWVSIILGLVALGGIAFVIFSRVQGKKAAAQ
jgi:hypothetical protein